MLCKFVLETAADLHYSMRFGKNADWSVSLIGTYNIVATSENPIDSISPG